MVSTEASYSERRPSVIRICTCVYQFEDLNGLNVLLEWKHFKKLTTFIIAGGISVNQYVKLSGAHRRRAVQISASTRMPGLPSLQQTNQRAIQHVDVTAVEGSVTRLIRELEHGSEEAAQRLWERYSCRLLELARRKLSNATRIVDEEDVAITVFESICRAAIQGRFTNLQNRHELWWLLVAVTKQKAFDQMRREGRKKRGGGRVVTETDAGREADRFNLDDLEGTEPTPEFLAIMEEEHRRLLGLLRDDQLRTIAVRRIEGYTYDEIATQLAISSRTVIRKLEQVKHRWQCELARHAE